MDMTTVAGPRPDEPPADAGNPARSSPGDDRRGRPRVVVAVAGGPESEALIRRGARVAERFPDGELMAVHVVAGSRQHAAEPAALSRQRRLVESLGGTWHTVLGNDVATALLDFARSIAASQLVVGVDRRTPTTRFRAPGTGARVVDAAGALDVHLLSHDRAAGSGPWRRRATALSRNRQLAAWFLAVTGSVALTAGFLTAGTGTAALSLNFLCHLTLVVFVAILGGWWPALGAALLSTMLINWFFTPPTRMLVIHHPENIVALGLFLLVAAGVARVVDVGARRTDEAGSARHQAGMLFELAGGVISEGLSVQALLDRLRLTYALQGVALVEHAEGPGEQGGRTTVLGSGGRVPVLGVCDNTVVVDDHHLLLIDGLPKEASDQGVLEAFAGRISGVLQQQALDEARLEARELAAGNAMRTALLAAVSHDLRTPLAAIKASVSSLRMEDVVLPDEDQGELLANIEESADQLAERVDDLLDMSRIQSGQLVVHRTALDLGDLAESAVRSATGADQATRVSIDIAPDAPPVLGDHGLLVRVVANLVENALKHSGPSPVVLRSATRPGWVQLLVVDRGPGVPAPDRDRIFQPFQRLGDREAGSGVGLGLAVARGLAEGMGGHVRAEDTPGGGLTMVLGLPAVDPADGGTAGAAATAAEDGEP
ncbi:ATP-binding protein [Kocuria sp. M1N1S27]|uniref:ATP-binding protein n=1 Tax=Kocuria kalidii TaxID=3376283 RepID=UPI00378D9E87